MKKICIVVPVYKQKLNLFEKISLKQLIRTLGNYPIYLVQPNTMKLRYEELDKTNYEICEFNKWYFQNTETYSKLMLSPFFYENFSNYEYMLVYQLDCFVFYDGLSDFCDRGYDYIGAPQYHSWTENAVVGNGGLSLRKIDTALTVTKNYKKIIQDPYYIEYFQKWEDNFFSYCGGQKNIKFTVPDIPQANTFSVVMDIENGIQNIPNNGLPFGTHAWHRMNFEFWKNIIQAYGYQTENLVAENNVNTLKRDRDARCKKHFFEMFNEFPYNIKQEIIKELGLLPHKKYVVWGAGQFGKKILKVLLDFGINITIIYDRDPNIEELYGICVVYPDLKKIHEQKLTVIISSEIYEGEIERQLLKNGYDNLIKLSYVFEKKWEIFWEKYHELFPEIEGVTVPFYFENNEDWIKKFVH